MNAKIVSNDQELKDAFSVRNRVFIKEQNVPAEEEIDHEEANSTHFVLYENNEPIGAGRFRIVDGYGKVERICVLKEFRKSGAGKTIMNTIEQYALKNEVSTLKLNAQTHAIPFYHSIGYETVSEEFLDAGIPHKSMKKNL